MNNVTLIGRLVADPELRYTPNGVAVAQARIAVDRAVKSEGQPEADFIGLVIWRATAEALCEHCKKGREIAVNGHIQTRNYENNEGTTIWVTEVVCESVKFLREPKESTDTPPPTSSTRGGNSTGATRGQASGQGGTNTRTYAGGRSNSRQSPRR